jgi:DNA helicase II / ATP-dependent DNA helicase PcrA
MFATCGWSEGLDSAQLEAVTAEPGPVLVVAGAGSGKTKTLAARVARLLEGGADPDRVLLLTFSRRAAKEMLHRAGRMTAVRTSRVWGGTFHAMGNRLLREYGHAVGLSPSFTILDAADASDLFGVVRTSLELAERGRRFPRKETLADIYSRVVNAQEPLAQVLKERFPWCEAEIDGIKECFTGYVERKAELGVLDYDDVLLYWRALAVDSPAADHLASRFDHVLVDEYQDTNLLQADIVEALAPGGRGLFVVGDDAQAIYGFRAASSANMLAFPERFPATQLIRLERNYRSVQPVLDVANAILSNASGVFDKNLRAVRNEREAARPLMAQLDDESSEAVYVCEQILDHREQGVALREQAVLFRTGHHSSRLEIELSRRSIPFVKYGGLKVLEAAHVKDLVAFLRLLDNPSDELAWHRVLALIDGVGPASIRKILDHLALPDPAAVRRLVEEPVPVPKRGADDLEVIRATFALCTAPDGGADPLPPAAEIEAIRVTARPLFDRRYNDAAVRMEDLRQLEEVAAASESRAAFLADVTLDPPSLTSDLAGPPLLDDDYLVLSTIHSAKGGEWDVVYLIHASDGNVPSDMALSSTEGLEEERRLLYVAITRARDHLYLTYPLRYYHRPARLDDAHTYGQPSRFLQGLPSDVLDRHVALTPAATSPASVGAGPDRVRAGVAGLWS